VHHEFFDITNSGYSRNRNLSSCSCKETSTIPEVHIPGFIVFLHHARLD